MRTPAHTRRLPTAPQATRTPAHASRRTRPPRPKPEANGQQQEATRKQTFCTPTRKGRTGLFCAKRSPGAARRVAGARARCFSALASGAGFCCFRAAPALAPAGHPPRYSAGVRRAKHRTLRRWRGPVCGDGLLLFPPTQRTARHSPLTELFGGAVFPLSGSCCVVLFFLDSIRVGWGEKRRRPRLRVSVFNRYRPSTARSFRHEGKVLRGGRIVVDV
jgi:hypothetical protein